MRRISLSVPSIQSDPTQISKTNLLIQEEYSESEGNPGPPVPYPKQDQMHAVDMDTHFIKVMLAWKLKQSQISLAHWLP